MQPASVCQKMWRELGGETCGRAAFWMQPFAGDQSADSRLFRRRKDGLMRDRKRGSAPDEAVDANWRWDGALRPGGTDCDNAVR